MLLNEFNESPAIVLAEALRPCLDVDRWINQLIASRPYASAEHIFAEAQVAASPFTAGEVASALAHHPRIGERLPGSGREAALSAAEQAGIDPADAAVTTQLLDGNRAYEEKFGRVFLIRALGRSPADILSALRERLTNPPEAEEAIVAGQLREIALLRLKEVIAP